MYIHFLLKFRCKREKCRNRIGIIINLSYEIYKLQHKLVLSDLLMLPSVFNIKYATYIWSLTYNCSNFPLYIQSLLTFQWNRENCRNQFRIIIIFFYGIYKLRHNLVLSDLPLLLSVYKVIYNKITVTPYPYIQGKYVYTCLEWILNHNITLVLINNTVQQTSC